MRTHVRTLASASHLSCRSAVDASIENRHVGSGCSSRSSARRCHSLGPRQLDRNGPRASRTVLAFFASPNFTYRSANKQCTEENKERKTRFMCAQTERLGRIDLFNSAGTTNQLTYTSSNPAKVCEYTAQTPRYRYKREEDRIFSLNSYNYDNYTSFLRSSP